MALEEKLEDQAGAAGTPNKSKVGGQEGSKPQEEDGLGDAALVPLKVAKSLSLPIAR